MISNLLNIAFFVSIFTAPFAHSETEKKNNPKFDSTDLVLKELRIGLGLEANTAEVCYDLENLAQFLAEQIDQSRPALQAYRTIDPGIARNYGNKHANLEIQANLVEALELSGVLVPRPYGVHTQQVHDLLKTRAPDVYTKWAELGKAYEAHPGPEAFLKSQLAQKLLSQIDVSIQKAFSSPMVLPVEMGSWIQELQKKGRYLMVRSTGAEDSKENANAGGNLSEAYIEPNAQDISTSIGNVVRSYFASRSLENRINAGRNPFIEELCLAVTTQELIGEPIGGAKELKDIPRSLILFSNEPLFVNGEGFRVMRLSATFGHGEGVVGNQGIGTDTVIIINSLAQPDQLQIFYENHAKPTRLTPVRDPATGKVSLQQTANPLELAKQRVFDNEELTRLFQWGLIGESYFAGPTDMEIVVLGDKIYPVQGRPINRPELLPTYLDLANKNAPVEASLRVDPIVLGKGSVVEITEANQVLVAATLEEAERAFDKNKHTLVIVSQKEPANSHPVVNFSSTGIPCLYVAPERMGDIKSWLKQLPQKSLAVCIQSGSMHLWDKTRGRIEDFRAKGYVAHPLQIAPSFQLEHPIIIVGRALTPPRELEDLILATNMAATPQEALAYLKNLREHPWVLEFAQGRAALESRLSKMTYVPIEAQRILEAIKQLEAKLEQTFKEAELAIKQQKGRLRPLLQTKILSVLLFGDGTESLNQLSIARIKPSIEAAREIANYQAQLKKPAKFADILLEGQRTPNPDIYSLWRKFLKKLERLPPKLTEAFYHMVSSIRASGEMARWMTLFFESAIHPVDFIPIVRNLISFGATAETLVQLKEQFPKSDHAPAQVILKQLEDIRHLKSQVADFGEPSKFETRFESLVKQTQTRTAEFLNAPGSKVLNIMRLQMMNEIVDLYDSAIKSMKMGHYADTEKIKLFKRMLKPYADLMLDWGINLIKEDNLWERPFKNKSGLTRQAYLHEIIQRLGGGLTNSLHPSKDFNVDAAKLGSKADFNRHLPETLEDFFTLVHQNLLVVIGYQLKEIDVLKFLQSRTLQPFKNLAKAIQNFDFNIGETRSRKATLIASKITEDTISIEYTLSLRQHSASLILEYNKDSDKVTLKGSFLGHNERWRWDKTAVLVEALQASRAVSLAKPTRKSDQGLDFTFEVKPEQIQFLLEKFSYFCELSNAHEVLFDFRVLDQILKIFDYSKEDPKLQQFALKLIQDESSPVAFLFGATLLWPPLPENQVFPDKTSLVWRVLQTRTQNPSGVDLLLDWSKYMLTQGRYSEATTGAYLSLLNSDDIFKQQNVLELFNRLVEKNKSHAEIMAAIIPMLQKLDLNLSSQIQKVLTALSRSPIPEIESQAKEYLKTVYSERS